MPRQWCALRKDELFNILVCSYSKTKVKYESIGVDLCGVQYIRDELYPLDGYFFLYNTYQSKLKDSEYIREDIFIGFHDFFF